jgi:hypothetical protein
MFPSRETPKPARHFGWEGEVQAGGPGASSVRFYEGYAGRDGGDRNKLTRGSAMGGEQKCADFVEAAVCEEISN